MTAGVMVEETVGERIVRLRRATRVAGRRMTQGQLAEAVGVTERAVGAWERGERTPGSKIDDLARVLSTTREYILEGDTPHPSLPPFLRSTDPDSGAIRDTGSSHQVVPVDESGLPLEDELEALRGWITDDGMRRMSRHTTPRAWLGMLYANGTHEGWPKERLDRIDAARRRVDELPGGTDQK